jgi:hypothetical protein
MFSEKRKMCVALMVLAAALVVALPMFAGSAIVGSVAGSMNATLGGQALVPNTTVFSGDSLQVKDGAAVVAVGPASRLVFGRETVASFLRDAGEVTVLLGQGNVSMYQGQASVGLRVKVGTVSVVPATGFKTLGEVAMVNGAVIVTAKEGKLRVEGNGPAVEVVKGKTITVNAKAARAPAPQGGAGAGVNAATALQVGSIAAGGTSAVMSGVAISRAGDARDAASAANSTAASAVGAAQDAQAAAEDATAAAEAAQATANDVGCALNAATANDPAFASPNQPYPPENCVE